MGIIRIYWDYHFAKMDKLVVKAFKAKVY